MGAKGAISAEEAPTPNQPAPVEASPNWVRLKLRGDEEVEEAEPVEEQAEAGPSTTTAAAAPTLTKKEKAKALRDAAAAKKAAAEQAEVEAEPAAPVDESFDGQYLASNACSGVLSVS